MKISGMMINVAGVGCKIGSSGVSLPRQNMLSCRMYQLGDPYGR